MDSLMTLKHATAIKTCIIAHIMHILMLNNGMAPRIADNQLS